MPLYLVDGPAANVLTLTEVKSHLRVDHADEDALIEALIDAAEQHLDGRNGWLGRALLGQTWELRLDEFCDAGIRLPLPPLIQVDHVRYYDINGVLQTVAETVYHVVGAGSAKPACIELKYNQIWPVVENGRNEAVIIQFRAGYHDPEASPTEGAVPAPIRQALLLTIGHLYANREDTVVGVSVAELPKAADYLLAPFRVQYFA